MNWVFVQRFEPTDLAIMIALADWADKDGYCFPGHQAILARIDISDRTLTRRLASLEERGIINRTRRFRDNGSRTSDAYWINLAEPSANLSGDTSDVHHPPLMADYREPSEEPSVQQVRADARGAPSTRGSRLVEGWRPKPETVAKAKVERVDVDLEWEHRKFEDYWLSTAGARAIKADWDRTWLNWMRNARATNRGQGQQTFAQQREQNTLSLIDELRREEAQNAAIGHGDNPGVRAIDSGWR